MTTLDPSVDELATEASASAANAESPVPEASAEAPVPATSAEPSATEPLELTAPLELTEPLEPTEPTEPSEPSALEAEGAGSAEAAEAPAPPAVDRAVVEALLFAADEPLTPAQIKKVLGGEIGDVRAVLDAIRSELDDRRAGFALVEVAGGFQLRTRPDYASWIRQLRSEKPTRLSKPALETLAVVSYKQPITRAEIEAIRRVDTGAVLKTLLDRRLIKIVGTKDVPGRPALYGTSREFLEVFRLKSLRELPTLKEIRDVAVEMGDALDVPGELLPEELGEVLARNDGSAPDASEGEGSVAREDELVEASADRDSAEPAIDTEEASGSPEDEPAPSPPSTAAEED